MGCTVFLSRRGRHFLRGPSSRVACFVMVCLKPMSLRVPWGLDSREADIIYILPVFLLYGSQAGLSDRVRFLFRVIRDTIESL